MGRFTPEFGRGKLEPYDLFLVLEKPVPKQINSKYPPEREAAVDELVKIGILSMKFLDYKDFSFKK